jgi:two-component sensor histidine kinase
MTATIDRLSTSDIQTDEALRLAALRRYDILDTPPDGSFDRIAAIAADLFSVPIAIVSLVDEDRIWFKSHHGLDVDQVDRSPGLCDSTILRSSPLILPDATADTHALANPLVAGEFGLRFYAGAPLRTHDGFNLGTLCVIDRHPRPVTERQVSQLEALASIVMDQMESRLSARRAIADLSRVVDEKEAALRRTDLMAKEIGHRVMNSLQLVSSLLNMQSRGMGSPEAAAQLALASRGVTAIALVHRHIHQSDNVGKASCKGYLERLGADLFGTLRSGKSDAIAVISDDVELPTEQIVALGLIVNEMVTNSVKYGASRITISLIREAPEGYMLTVTDDGTGLPADFDPASTPGFGMKMLSALAGQLGGELRFGGASSASGANFSIHVAKIPTARNI